ncbi:hypothetical protein MTO96_035473 [Rhipicephalus appendiculatus]
MDRLMVSNDDSDDGGGGRLTDATKNTRVTYPDLQSRATPATNAHSTGNACSSTDVTTTKTRNHNYCGHTSASNNPANHRCADYYNEREKDH